MKQKVVIETISSLLILVFVYAASSKLIEYSAFQVQVRNSARLRPLQEQLSGLLFRLNCS